MKHLDGLASSLAAEEAVESVAGVVEGREAEQLDDRSGVAESICRPPAGSFTSYQDSPSPC